jgi:hypothetical protein
MNPVFAPLNIVHPFDAAQPAARSGAAGRNRIRANYLTALSSGRRCELPRAALAFEGLTPARATLAWARTAAF